MCLWCVACGMGDKGRLLDEGGGHTPFSGDTAACKKLLSSFKLAGYFRSRQSVILWNTVPRLLVEGIAISVNDLEVSCLKLDDRECVGCEAATTAGVISDTHNRKRSHVPARTSECCIIILYGRRIRATVLTISYLHINSLMILCSFVSCSLFHSSYIQKHSSTPK